MREKLLEMLLEALSTMPDKEDAPIGEESAPAEGLEAMIGKPEDEELEGL